MKILYVSKNFEKKQRLDLEKTDPDEWVMVVDADRCISCGACELACQMEHGEDISNRASFRPIQFEEPGGRGKRTVYLPLACRHCEDPCEYYSSHNFWVTCPEGRKTKETLPLCDFCAERAKRGFWPACATRCSMKTIYFGPAQDVRFALGEKRLRELGEVAVLR